MMNNFPSNNPSSLGLTNPPQVQVSNPYYYNQIGINPNAQQSMWDNMKASWNASSFADRMNTVFGGLQTLGNLYAGLRGVSLANKQFKQQQDQWNKTWDATKKGLNESLAVRSYNRNNGNMAAVKRDQERYGV